MRDLDTSLGYLTNLAGRLFVRALERRLPGGSAGPMPVFIALADGGEMTQATLARLATVEQPTMANTLSRMQRDGLVEGVPDPTDRRSTLIRLTPAGHERARQAQVASSAVNALASEALTPEERDSYIQLIKRIIARLEADG